MRPQRQGNIEFEYEGDQVQIRYRKPTMRQLRELAELEEGSKDESELGEAVLQVVCEKYLVNWNVEDEEGNVVAVNFENMMDMPGDFVMKVMEGWAEAAAGIPIPLDLNSIDLSSLNLGRGNSPSSSSTE